LWGELNKYISITGYALKRAYYRLMLNVILTCQKRIQVMWPKALANWTDRDHQLHAFYGIVFWGVACVQQKLGSTIGHNT